jgi:hypothetical protein
VVSPDIIILLRGLVFFQNSFFIYGFESYSDLGVLFYSDLGINYSIRILRQNRYTVLSVIWILVTNPPV